MGNTPVIALAGYSGSGKTTLMEKLIARLKEDGLRIAAVKHDGHSFEIDHEGKDSWRFTRAGADITVIASAEQTAFLEHRSVPLDQLLGRIRDVDLILVEGYKHAPLPQIGVARKGNGKGFTAELSRFLVIATDLEVDSPVPRYDLDDIEGLARFIRERLENQGK